MVKKKMYIGGKVYKTIEWLVNSLPSIFSSPWCTCVVIILFAMAEEEMFSILLVELLLLLTSLNEVEDSFQYLFRKALGLTVSTLSQPRSYIHPSVSECLVCLLYYYFSFLLGVSISKNIIIQVFKRYNMSIRIIASSEKCKITLINTHQSLNV